jgi:hypothetical protein
MSLVLRRPLEDNYSPGQNPISLPRFIPTNLDSAGGPELSGNGDIRIMIIAYRHFPEKNHCLGIFLGILPEFFPIDFLGQRGYFQLPGSKNLSFVERNIPKLDWAFGRGLFLELRGDRV